MVAIESYDFIAIVEPLNCSDGDVGNGDEEEGESTDELWMKSSKISADTLVLVDSLCNVFELKMQSFPVRYLED